ncbi:MAG TPA: immunoglobulin domain-containing protein [Anaerohalosphaeraceae bacterium]|nr:immunoglobulin domain-containing protein [Anaerohalosphaeraceae bacterium]HQJ68990.1 immunoglobulin domain-containing protein [Anaerohalosphaeraceae bacterium]
MKKIGIVLLVVALGPASASAATLISRYSFNETSGSTVSDSVSGLNGTLQGAAVFNGTGSAVLNGTSGTYVSLNPTSLSDLSAVTLDAWFIYTVGNNNVHLFSIDNGGGTGSSGSYLRLNVYDNRETGPFIEGIQNWIGNKTVDDVPLEQGQEIHVTVVYDGVNHYEALYVDGVLAFELTGTVTSVPALSGYPKNVFTLGRSPWANSGDPYLVGSINEFRVFNGALTGGEIQTYDFWGPDKLTGPIVDPIPSNAAVNVPLTQTLSWTVIGPNVEFIDLYFGTENDPNLSTKPDYKKLSMEPATTTSYVPTLNYSTNYYWKINVYEPNAAPGATDYIMTAGPVWRFITIGQAPQVTPVSPAITTVDAGQAAVLSVTAINVDAYQWYKAGNANPLSNGAKYTGTATNTLTINDVQLADEGQYYCQATNTAYPDPVDSVPGLVMTKRMIIHYPLDTVVSGVTPDVVSGYDMTLVSADSGTDLPTLVTGVPELGGNALFFNNSSRNDPNFWGQYATAGDVDMEAMGNGLTISFWVQWIGNNGDYQGIVNRQGTWNASDMMWRIDKDRTTGDINFGRNGSVQGSAVLDQAQWNYITVTVNNTGGVVKTYKNGELVDTDSGFTYGTGVNSGFKLGCNTDAGEGLLYGMIDDVKVYNYARTTEQVGNDYLAVKGGWICNNEGSAELTYDFNDDCQVDLADFALLAADWLNSNRIYAQ